MNINKATDPNKPEAPSTAIDSAEPRPEGAPRVSDHYAAFTFTVAGSEDNDLAKLSSTNCSIGERLPLSFEDGGKVVLMTRGRNLLAVVPQEHAARLRELDARGWEIVITPLLVLYTQESKSFSGEFAAMAINPQGAEVAESLRGFVRRILKRIKGGDHPHVTLTQEQFEKVLETRGEWCVTRGAPMPEKRKGEVVFKRRQSRTEYLQGLSYEHRVGCSIASWSFIALVVVGIVLLVWLL
ncbi:MAG: hypothetical protein K6G78_02470 [bacterium]|nr:hypothetical protein [bacterium]